MWKLFFLLFLLFNLSHADKLGVYQKLGQIVPLDLTFLDENSNRVSLKQMMDNKPTILTLNYLRCPKLCTPQLQDLASTLERLDLLENIDYKVLTVSFAPSDTPELAAKKRKNHISSINRDFIKDAWHFLVDDNGSSKILAESVGFAYEKKVSLSGDINYIHPAALIVLSPDGKITRYLNGIKQLPFDVKLALLEASDGKIGPTIAKTLLYCYAYDPVSKTYVFAAGKVIATLMLVIVFSFFTYLVITGRKRESVSKQEEKDE